MSPSETPIQPKLTVDEFIGLRSCPSKLIRMAVDDLEKIENDSRYEIDMGHWHLPIDDYWKDDYKKGTQCAVCLAGSFLACELAIPLTATVNVLKLYAGAKGVDADVYYSEPPDVVDKYNQLWEIMRALDYFRRGYIGSALSELGISRFEYERLRVEKEQPYYEDWPDSLEMAYEDDPVRCKTELRNIADYLERLGL